MGIPEGLSLLALSRLYWRQRRWAYFALPIVALYEADRSLHLFNVFLGTDDAWYVKGIPLGWVLLWLTIAAVSYVLDLFDGYFEGEGTTPVSSAPYAATNKGM